MKSLVSRICRVVVVSVFVFAVAAFAATDNTVPRWFAVVVGFSAGYIVCWELHRFISQSNQELERLRAEPNDDWQVADTSKFTMAERRGDTLA